MFRPPPLLRLLLHRHFSLSGPSHSHLIRPILPPSFFPAARSLSSSSPSSVSPLAQSISAELIKHSTSTTAASNAPDSSPTAEPRRVDIADHFSLHFSDVRFNTPLLVEILNLSPAAGRAALDFYRWLVRARSFDPNDESLSHLVTFFGRRHDFKSVQDVLVEFRRGNGPKTYRAAIDRLVRAGRAAESVKFFDDMERDYGIKRDRSTLSVLVTLLCDHGFGSYAEKIVRRYANRIFPDEEMCHSLVKGWCLAERPDEAVRLMGEMIRGGFDIKTPAYNSILDSVCKLSRKKDPLTMRAEAEKVLVEMESKGIARDTDTFRILITNLCKIRKTEDAMKVFGRMSEWGCSPDADIYLALIRSLYQAARVSEGDDIIRQMWSAGFKVELDVKNCYGFLKILCGIERVDHAMKVFRLMKGYSVRPGIQTYELLMEKLSAHNQVDRANALFQEALGQGLPVTPKTYVVDPRYVKKPEVKKEKKRPTMPEKILMKRKRLKKLKLSFVKKPNKRRAY